MKKISKSVGLTMVILNLVLSMAACNSNQGTKESSEGSKSSEATTIVVPEGEPKVVFDGYGSAAFGPMEITLDLYEGGVLIFTSTYAKRETIFDGTWSMSEDEKSITVNINEREKTTTWEAPKGDDGFYTFDYKTFDGKGEAVIAFTTEVK